MKNNILVLLLLSVLIVLSSCGNDNLINENEDKITEQIQEEMKDDIIDISKKVQEGEITEEEAEDAMLDSMNNSETIQTQLEKSKEEMPKLLEILKFNKECLTKADNKSDAKKCEEGGIELAKELGMENMYELEENDEDFEWSNEIKEEILVDLDEGINQFEIMLPCVEKAETMTDMMQCGNF